MSSYCYQVANYTQTTCTNNNRVSQLKQLSIAIIKVACITKTETLLFGTVIALNFVTLLIVNNKLSQFNLAIVAFCYCFCNASDF